MKCPEMIMQIRIFFLSEIPFCMYLDVLNSRGSV